MTCDADRANLYSHFTLIRTRPSMYTGDNSVTLIAHHLACYEANALDLFFRCSKRFALHSKLAVAKHHA